MGLSVQGYIILSILSFAGIYASITDNYHGVAMMGFAVVIVATNEICKAIREKK